MRTHLLPSTQNRFQGKRMTTTNQKQLLNQNLHQSQLPNQFQNLPGSLWRHPKLLESRRPMAMPNLKRLLNLRANQKSQWRGQQKPVRYKKEIRSEDQKYWHFD